MVARVKNDALQRALDPIHPCDDIYESSELSWSEARCLVVGCSFASAYGSPAGMRGNGPASSWCSGAQSGFAIMGDCCACT